MAILTRNRIVTSGLILNLDAANSLSYTSGSSDWKDLSGNNNNARAINTPTSSFNNGGGVGLNGINNYFTQSFYTTNYFTANQSWTINACVNVISPTGSGFGIVGGDKGGILTNQRYRTEPDPGGFGLNIYNLQYCINLTSGSGADATTNELLALTPINYNTNEFITAVWDSVTSTASIYRNGRLVNSSSNISYKWTPRSTGILQRIGTSTQGGWSYFFPMILYNVSLYNRALSQQEITQNYNALKSRFNLT